LWQIAPIRQWSESILSRNPLIDGCGEAEVVTFDGYWQYQVLSTGLPCSPANAICARNAGNGDFLAIKTQLSYEHATTDERLKPTASVIWSQMASPPARWKAPAS